MDVLVQGGCTHVATMHAGRAGVASLAHTQSRYMPVAGAGEPLLLSPKPSPSAALALLPPPALSPPPLVTPCTRHARPRRSPSVGDARLPWPFSHYAPKALTSITIDGLVSPLTAW